MSPRLRELFCSSRLKTKTLPATSYAQIMRSGVLMPSCVLAESAALSKVVGTIWGSLRFVGEDKQRIIRQSAFQHVMSGHGLRIP